MMFNKKSKNLLFLILIISVLILSACSTKRSKEEALKKEAQNSKIDETILTPEQEAELQYIIEHNMLFFKRNKMDEDDAKKLADILREFYIETLEQK